MFNRKANLLTLQRYTAERTKSVAFNGKYFTFQKLGATSCIR
jgi:hypothetical protein